jgi:hypothetical protein
MTTSRLGAARSSAQTTQKGDCAMSALDAALQHIDDVAADGDLAPTPTAALPAIDPEDAGEPVELPDGRRIYVPRLHGRRVDELACALLDLEAPARSKFLRLTGPPGT